MQRGWTSTLGLGESTDPPAGGVSRGHTWQTLRASFGKGKWGATAEETGYVLYIRKDTTAAVGRMIWKKGSDWRHGDQFRDCCSNQGER